MIELCFVKKEKIKCPIDSKHQISTNFQGDFVCADCRRIINASEKNKESST